MENVNTEYTDSRKKFLVPVVVLMVCAVSLVGAAYAYSSSVTITGNTVTGDEYVLEVKEEGGTQLISEPLALKAIELTHTTDIGPGATDSVLVIAEAKANYSYLGKLTLKDTTVTNGSGTPYIYADVTPSTNPTWTINGSAITVGEDPNDVGEGTLSIKVTVALYKDDNEAKGEAYTAGDAIVFDNEYTATLWYEVTVTVTGDGISFNNITAQEDVTAVKNAIAANTYTLSFVAQPTARA